MILIASSDVLDEDVLRWMVEEEMLHGLLFIGDKITYDWPDWSKIEQYVVISTSSVDLDIFDLKI